MRRSLFPPLVHPITLKIQLTPAWVVAIGLASIGIEALLALAGSL